MRAPRPPSSAPEPSIWQQAGEPADRRALGMTVRDRVAQELRHRILFGSLPAGHRLDLDALSAEFGTSRTPLREACLELAADRLVKVAPRSGVMVLGITDGDLLDNFALMATLASMAAEWAAARATEDDLDRIVRARDAVEDASRGGQGVARENFDFHRAVNQASHSRRLLTLIDQTARLFPERFSEVVPAQVQCAIPEHAAIVAAISDRDAEHARILMADHFEDALQRLRRLLKSEIGADTAI